MIPATLSLSLSLSLSRAILWSCLCALERDAEIKSPRQEHANPLTKLSSSQNMVSEAMPTFEHVSMVPWRSEPPNLRLSKWQVDSVEFVDRVDVNILSPFDCYH